MRLRALPHVFISYRRDDSSVHARSLYRDLSDAFGRRRVFFDVENIDYGDAFARVIDARIAAADVVVVVVGPRWATLTGADGQPRIRAERDVVRREVAAALRMGKRVIPVLVAGARLPARAELPDDVAALLELNALAIGDRELGASANVLVDTIRGASGTRTVTQQRWRNSLRLLALAGSTAVLGGAWIGLFDTLTLDTKTASVTLWLADLVAPADAGDDVRIVAIDPRTERARGKPFRRNPSARRDHAELIRKLSAAGARTIGFDLFVVTPSPEDDAVLLAAIAAARAADTAVVFGARDIERDVPVMLPPLRAAVSAVGMLCYGERLGYASTVPLASQQAPGPNARARATGLALAVAYPGVATIDDVAQRVLVSGPQGIRAFAYSESERVGRIQRCKVGSEGDVVATALYRAAPLESLRSAALRTPYEAVLAMEPAALRQRFAGKRVLVGLTMPDDDVFETFHGWSGELRHGLELHADATAALLGDRVVQPIGWMPQFAILLALAVLGSRISGRAEVGDRRRRVLALAGTLVACAAGAVAVCAGAGRLLNVTYLAAALLGGYLLASAARRMR